MGASIEIKAQGADRALRVLSYLAARFGDLSPLMRGIAAYLRTSTVRRFETNVGPDGVAWKPSLRVRLYGGQTLVQRGLLRDSIIDDSGRDFAAVGTNDPRAAAHQFGVTIRPRNARNLAFNLPGVGFRMVKSVTLPPRPFIGLSTGDVDEIEAMSGEYMLDNGMGLA